MKNGHAKTLVITNGDTAAERMREARINDQILCWRDILHEGPVPQTDTLDELDEIRIDYLVYEGWGDPDEIRQAFAERSAIMHNLKDYSDITLWFEHDLYDQLQLLQILDFLRQQTELHSRISLIQTGNFIGHETPSRLRMHLKLKSPVTPTQYALAGAAWSAFCAPTPENWFSLLSYNTSALPFLRPSILRHLEEFPAPVSGLSRTEAFILEMVYTGIATPIRIFQLFQDEEEAAFMGDLSFWRILDDLAYGAAPFVTGLQNAPFSSQFDDEQREVYLGSELKLTGLGTTALLGKRDAAEFRRLNRWMGGTHLTPRSCWRWNAQAKTLVRPNARRY
ncbi:MAG: DUF1835 domain-containing protein [Hyphomicrobiales bacterium]|nr:DUF1835 domain-containing protein [Hyphomicrobiales bacterium]